MPRPSPRLVAACAGLLAALTVWLAVAAFLDAQHAEQLRGAAALQPSASFFWWATAGAGTPLATLGLGLIAAGLAGWARFADAGARAPATVALVAVAGTSAAVAVVGVGALATYAGGSVIPFASPQTALAKFAAMAIGGLMLLVATTIAAAPARPGVAPSRAAVGAGVALALALGGGGAEAADRTTHFPDTDPGEITFSMSSGPGPSISTSPPVAALPSAVGDARIAGSLAIAADPPGVSVHTDCEDSPAGNVAGAHEPRNCAATYASITAADGATDQVWVERFDSPREAAYQYGVELRYDRQYAGLRSDQAIPGITESRMIHTGDAGNLFTIVVRQRACLVIVFVSSARYGSSVTKADMTGAVALARRMTGMLRR